MQWAGQEEGTWTCPGQVGSLEGVSLRGGLAGVLCGKGSGGGDEQPLPLGHDPEGTGEPRRVLDSRRSAQTAF